MKLTLSGLAGTGTSTVGRALASKLNYKFVSSGDFCRQLGDELGLTINQFDELCSQDPSYDKRVDQKIVEFGKSNDDFVAEGRMTWHFVSNALKIKLDCEINERIRRISGREKISQERALEETMARQNIVASRFEKAYGIKDLSKDENFDLIIDTTNINSNEVVDKIISHIMI